MINIIKAGLLTTVQDLGRYGFQKDGVIASGVMDPFAHRLANLLVGNDENEATLEITLMGPVIRFEKEALIALCGGNLTPLINGQIVRPWRPIYVERGSELRFGPCRSGCRMYLAIAGGYDIKPIMGSRSTYLRAGIGGHEGRSLKTGDELGSGPISAGAKRSIQSLKQKSGELRFSEAGWTLAADRLPYKAASTRIRVIKGGQYDLFTKESQALFFKEPFEILSQSDRMGYRLKGPSLELKEDLDMLSEGVSFGTVQVPTDGQPIVLLADRQTTGGYPKIAQIATVDLPRLAQYKPGDVLTFEEISHKEAQELLLKTEEQILHLKRSIFLK